MTFIYRLREYRVHATMEEREAAKEKRGKKSKYKAGDEEVAAVAGGTGEESSKMEPAVGLGAEKESAVALEVGPETPEAPLLPTAPAQQQNAGMQEAKGVAVVMAGKEDPLPPLSPHRLPRGEGKEG